MSWTSAESWLLHTAVGGGLLLLLVLMLMRLARQPVTRQRVGEWGLAAALLVAVLSLGPSWLDVPWLSGGEETRVSQTVEPLLPEFHVVTPQDDGDIAQPFPAEVTTMAVADAPETSILASLGPWLVWLFSVGAALFLGHWLLGYFVLGRLLRDATQAPDAVAELFRQMCGQRRRGRLLVSSRLPVPVSCGVFRPTIVLPKSLCEPKDFDKLRWVFAHELAHLERRDAWSTVLFGLGQTIYFYLPWFWSLRRQVRLCQEYIADAAAIQAVGASADVPAEVAADYAEFLLSLTKSPAVPVVATGVSGNTSDLFRRVSMLLQNPLRVERRCSQLWSFVTGAVLLTAAILLGGIDLTAEASDPGLDIIAELTPEQVQELKNKVPVRFLFAADEGGEIQKKVIVFKAGEPAQADVIIKKEPGQEKKIVIYRAVTGQPTKVSVFGSSESQLDPLRKALEKLEKSGSLNAEQIRQEVMKALEAIKATPAGEKGKQQRIEIRLHVDPSNKHAPQVQVIPAPAVPLTPPPAAQQPTLFRAVTVPSAHVDADAIRKAVEKAMAGVDNAADVAKAVEKALKGVAEKKAMTGTFQFQHVAPHIFTGAKIDFQTVRKLIEQLEKSPNDTKALHELMQALGKGAAGHNAWFHLAHPVPPAPPKAPPAPNVPAAPKVEVRAIVPSQGPYGSSSGTSSSPYTLHVQYPIAKSGQSRLGISVDQPSSLLADQLNLPKGQGLVITDVKADSPAAKAGLKSNDILLEISKQKVPTNTSEFVKMVTAMKSGTAVDAVVLRKGKRETISGITLAEAAVGTPATVSTRVKAVEALGNLVGKVGQGGGANTISTTTLRNGDKFTTRYQEGSLIISVVGSVKQGKASAQEISVQDGSTTHKHTNVGDVPAQYRDKVNYILELSAKGEFRTESK